MTCRARLRHECRGFTSAVSLGWLFLGLVALPFAAVLYVLVERFGPRLLEPEPALPEASPAGETPAGWRLSPGILRYARAAAAVIVLGLVAFGVSRWPAAPSGGSRPIPKAVEVQLP